MAQVSCPTTWSLSGNVSGWGFAGLPTGSSPIPTYKKLIEFHKAGELSFANVVTFKYVQPLPSCCASVSIPPAWCGFAAWMNTLDYHAITAKATIISCGRTSSHTLTSSMCGRCHCLMWLPPRGATRTTIRACSPANANILDGNAPDLQAEVGHTSRQWHG